MCALGIQQPSICERIWMRIRQMWALWTDMKHADSGISIRYIRVQYTRKQKCNSHAVKFCLSAFASALTVHTAFEQASGCIAYSQWQWYSRSARRSRPCTELKNLSNCFSNLSKFLTWKIKSAFKPVCSDLFEFEKIFQKVSYSKQRPTIILLSCQTWHRPVWSGLWCNTFKQSVMQVCK